MSNNPRRWVAAGVLAAACIPLATALAQDQDTRTQTHTPEPASVMPPEKGQNTGMSAAADADAGAHHIGGRWIAAHDGALRRVDGKPATEADVAAAAAELHRIAEGLDHGASNMHRSAGNMTGPAAAGAAGMHAAAEQMHEQANDARALAARLHPTTA